MILINIFTDTNNKAMVRVRF